MSATQSTRPRARNQAEAPRKTGRKLDYRFDPVPKIATDLVAAGTLQPIDLQVLALLLRYRSRLRTSCWTTIPHLAREIERSERTVQRSLKRLQAAGLIHHVEVPTPDPDEPRNKTGWRFQFAWMEVAAEVTPVSPGECQPCHPPGDIGVTQRETEANRLPPAEKKNQDDDPACVREPAPASEPEPRSSSSVSSQDQEQEPPADDLAPLVAKATARFGVGRERVATAVAEFGRDWVEAALNRANLREWGGVLATLRNWRAEGGPTRERRPYQHPPLFDRSKLK
jgi:predicted transcriptional regulator